MNEHDNASNQISDSLGYKIITLGSMVTRIGDAISSFTSTINFDENTDINNQQYLEELEQKLQILHKEINDCTKDILEQMI